MMNQSKLNVSQTVLRHDVANFRPVLDASPIPYALNDAQQNIIYLNVAFVKTFGYDLQDIPALKDWWLCAYPDESYRRWVEETWQFRLAHALTTGQDFEPLEINIRCKDGSSRTVMASAGSLGDALPDVHLVTLYDITERKQVEEALRKSEARFRAIVNSAPVPIGMNDANLNITLINPAFTKAYGYTLEDLPTVNDWWIKAYPDVEYREHIARLWFKHVEQAQQQGFFEPLEGYLQCKDGSVRSVHSIAQTMAHSGETIVINYDITERKQAERERERLLAELEQKNEQVRQDALIKAELLSEVNHRVKNNLTRIQSIFNLKSREFAADSKELQLLQDMQTRIVGMLDVHMMLSSSLWMPLALGELCQHIVNSVLRSSSSKAQLHTEYVFQPERCANQMIIPGQATTLALVLNELAMNCVKYAFTERRTGRISMCVTVDQQHNLLHLIFRDDGPGWPPEVLAGNRDGLGLRLIRNSLHSLPQGLLQLHNDGGAVAELKFKLARP